MRNTLNSNLLLISSDISFEKILILLLNINSFIK